jgi:hypothetical protein
MSSITSITIFVKSPNNKQIFDYLVKMNEIDVCGVKAFMCVYEPCWEVETDIMVTTEVRGTIEVHDLKTSVMNLFTPFNDVEFEISFDNLECGDYGKLLIDKDGATYKYLDNNIVMSVLDEFYNCYDILDDKLETNGEVIKL